jgi:hypothetical protein
MMKHRYCLEIRLGLQLNLCVLIINNLGGGRVRNIKNLVGNFINIYKTNNVYEICSQLNIKIYKSHLKDIKGYFLNISEGISIVIDYNFR